MPNVSMIDGHIDEPRGTTAFGSKPIEIERYVEALNNLIGVDNAYFQGDADVDALVECIGLVKQFEETVNRQEEQINGWIAGQETLQKHLAEKQKQIEKLEKIEHFATKTIDAQHAEIERLKPFEKKVGVGVLENLKQLEYEKSTAIKEFAETAYKLLCNKENWNTLKESWLENGECPWLKQLFDKLVRDAEN